MLGCSSTAAHEPDTVLSRVEAALLHAFGFDRRRFAQGVTASEVIATVHRVDGVIAVDLDALHRGHGAGAARHARIRDQGAACAAGRTATSHLRSCC
jgi:hypothetical protein